MIVADSSVWIEHFRGNETRESRALAAAIERRTILVGDLILAEVLQGFRNDALFRRAVKALADLPFAAIGGREIAIAAANNYRKLRAIGVTPRKTIDVLIATFCIENGHSLLHSDRDFDAMRDHLGLRTI